MSLWFCQKYLCHWIWTVACVFCFVWSFSVSPNTRGNEITHQTGFSGSTFFSLPLTINTYVWTHLTLHICTLCRSLVTFVWGQEVRSRIQNHNTIHLHRTTCFRSIHHFTYPPFLAARLFCLHHPPTKTSQPEHHTCLPPIPPGGRSTSQADCSPFHTNQRDRTSCPRGSVPKKDDPGSPVAATKRNIQGILEAETNHHRLRNWIPVRPRSLIMSATLSIHCFWYAVSCIIHAVWNLESYQHCKDVCVSRVSTV